MDTTNLVAWLSFDDSTTQDKHWRYVNLGTADDLITSGTTLTDLPATKSITGTAFYQTTRAKCFDLPATSEIWIKFDVYFDGSNRWRAFNGGANGTNGVTAYSGSYAGTFAHAQNGSIANTVANICKTNQLQTVLLHMVSGSSDGIIEAWVDGTKIYTYTGNVNHGEDFADIYLQSDGSGTFFSNVLISNARIGLNDGYKSFSADVVRRVKNRVEFSVDVARIVQKKWRYVNLGTADDLITSGTTLTDLPESKSKTGVAFYQTTRAKCFDLPATPEIWIKFDVYFDGSNRWRAYNGATNLNSGVCVENGNFCYFVNQGDSYYEQFTNVQKTNTLQTVLFHMVSGSSAGVVEAWVDGDFIYRYTGNVNKGNDFADIYLQSDGSGTFFSNVLISNAQIGLDENAFPKTIVTFDVVRRVKNRVQVTFDVARRLFNRVEFSVDVARIITDSRFISVNQSFDVVRNIVKSVSFTADVARIVQKNWRYVNLGNADDLIISGTTLTDLPESKSKTGVAFYQTTRAKCFDLPATPEIWLKFDLYHYSGTSRFRVYDDSNGSTANGFVLTQNSSTQVALWSFDGSANYLRKTFDGVLKANTLQTWLLHMISGDNDGLLELWCDGLFVGSYSGNVNNGVDFDNIYLQSDNADNLFSNVIISNDRIGLNDGYKTFTADVARRLKNRVQVTFDVERYLLKPIHVPLIGEHFNHYIRSIIVSNSPTIFKLPKKSKVYIHATSPVDISLYVQWRAVRIFTDTDAAGTVTGDVYATFDECERVSIQSTVSPQSILSDFTWKLRDLGGDKLDAAIEYCTGGLFTTKDELADSFLTDLDNSESNLDFLLRCCGVDLSNDDTGAVVGSDAGGGHPKTTKLIVPESVPVEEWVVPGSGSSKYIYGLTVYFPTTGANGALTDAEKHILAGLNSVWIYQALWLIDKSCKMEFANLPTQRTRSISVKFVNETNNTLAYVAATYSGNWAIKLELCINMRVYSAIDITSEDGATSNQNDTYLDRTLAHEFTHAVMAAGIGRYSDLPLFIKEGIAEFIHGIDDEKRSSIRHITQPAQRGTLQTIFSTGGTAGDEDVYSAGYLFFRYMVRQTLERGNLPLPPSDTMYNLVISDGAIDYFGRALTDNTRQIFSADVARTLIKSLGLIVDVVIRDAIRVSFAFDVARAILAELILFPITGTNLLQSKSATRLKAPVLNATPKNTQGLQSFEVNIGEQQITEQINFAGIIPFDILQQVNGQYLDYHFNMRVEKVQQEGIIYRCECCSDLDQLLFTQLAYKIPPSTWRKVGADDTTVEIETYYPPATAHVQKIASALGLTPVMQFDNFLSTVLMDDLGGVTYNDLIRDVFGWSSRVPHQLINCYIRDGKLYVIQRGHEANTVDISNAKCTMPVITKELVRTTWGSTPWSKTKITEFQHSSWQAGVPDDVTIGGGSSDTGGGSTLPSGDDDEDEQVREVSTQFYGHDYHGHTTYTYDRKGLLIQTYTYVEKDINGRLQETHTTVKHDYDDDNTMIYTETFVQSFGAEGESSSRSIEEKGYVTLPNGEKFLAWEHAATYQNDEGLTPTDSDLVDSKVTVHSPSRVGQTHTMTINTDGDIIGSAAGQNTGDDRVTPFSKYNAAVLGKKLFSSNSNTISGGSSGGSSSSGQWTTDTETYELTNNGLSLYDSSFPIHNESKLIQVTQALRWLNRKTQETLSITLYEFPHLIDFNDRIIFNGKSYFLVNNTATTTPRILNEQNLTLRRWY